MIKKITKNSKLKTQNAFTLIEVMVAVSIFAIVVLVSMTAVLSVIDANKKAQALDDVINNMNFSVESMVRDLRTGYNYTCGAGPSSPISSCFVNTGEQQITFSSSISGCDVTYSRKVNAIDSNIHTIYKKECVGGADQALTSNNIDVKKFDLFVSNTDASAHLQPLILMILQATAKVGKQSTEFDLQTLISQRRLNI